MKTARRNILDKYLCLHQHHMLGDVLDIGGKKENKRGDFRPPMCQVSSWKYLNMDDSCDPDFCCNAASIPVPDASFDLAIMCEVIEHLEKPDEVLRESHRVLKIGGWLIASIPFLFPIHSDPHDYQRWTETKISMELEKAGYREVKIEEMGGVGAVVHDLLLVSMNGVQNRIIRALALRSLRLVAPVLRHLENMKETSGKRITTGYFILARK